MTAMELDVLKINKMKKIVILLICFQQFYSCTQPKQWQNISLSTKDHLHDIEVIDDKIAISYSYGTGKLFKTINSGETWKQIHQFDSIYFEQIQFIDKNVGWICGSPNKLFKTSDGGITWTDISTKEKPNSLIYGMLFTDKNIGYFSEMYRSQKGMFSDIYQTNNGGEDWQLIHTIKAPIVNLEKLDNTIYGTGSNIIIKDIDKEEYAISFLDSTRKVGGIRDIAINKNGEIKAASFNGYVLSLANNQWVSKQITKNRLRSISTLDKFWLVAGDSIKEPNHIFKSIDGENWNSIQNQYPDVHRTVTLNNTLWMAGKKGFITKKTY